MNSNFLTLGIESSCDDTAVSVLEGQRNVKADFISSQIKEHAPFGGVVPEFASRMHLEAILPLIQAAFSQAGISSPASELSLIAVTAGPGLMGSLMVGVMTAKAFAQSWGVPLLGVNHLEGHLFANVVASEDLLPPFICLIVSGGHTEIILVEDWGQYQLLGETRDDAAGEAYDKVAKLLGLGYPGGPVIDRLAQQGNPEAFRFPVPLKGSNEIAFSFSGLKTAVLWTVNELQKSKTDLPVADICASFQRAAVTALVSKLERATEVTGIQKIAISGGVAANKGLRKELLKRKYWEVFIPPVIRCTDNAVMIAAAGYNSFQRGNISDLSLAPNPSWHLLS
ncbi:tRNA (adenosine(37)-N6)-threonylcarbamoyltransferase complex transferase subunit TsaD [Aminobacterium mobile]|uniref:tRNA (adenosine(37)-N6)-threonylcarbamoyltransferase complex transferase subunit TsaD n=1 Tax=Aminobacterium mobile TaxID=81467 RepID=UPI000466F780|nr:tRNA (adenosine(37)-N6)-threonylcarbamoyltransferase complex transferase subunit TsaD [Aminobacterium mobile]